MLVVLIPRVPRFSIAQIRKKKHTVYFSQLLMWNQILKNCNTYIIVTQSTVIVQNVNNGKGKIFSHLT